MISIFIKTLHFRKFLSFFFVRLLNWIAEVLFVTKDVTHCRVFIETGGTGSARASISLKLMVLMEKILENRKKPLFKQDV
jgi:hypothetical protein